MKNQNKEQDLNDCCAGSRYSKEKVGFFKGLVYGLIPHTFCILFILLSVIGATAGASFFRKFLMVPNFFEFLIAISIIFAIISALFYLKRNGILSLAGIKRKWKYLTVLFGTTILINIVMIYVVFPATSKLNVTKTAPPITQDNKGRVDKGLIKATLSVDIPCSGHSFLIKSELAKVAGVKNIQFIPQNQFIVTYDPKKTNVDSILSISVFKTYKAKVV